MKKLRKGLLALAMTFVMACSLAACDDGNDFDASGYVKGLLDEWYLGEFDPAFLESLESTENEAQEIYLDSIQQEVDRFCLYNQIDYPTEALNDRLLELMKQVSAKADYTVNPATGPDSDGTYSVKVQVRPLDVIKLVDDAMSDEWMDEFNTMFPSDEEISAMGEDQFNDWYQNVYDPAYGDAVADVLESVLPKMGYLDEKSIVVQVEKDGDYLTLNSDDSSNLATMIITYDY